MGLQLRLAGQDGEVPLALSQPVHDLVLLEGGHQGQLLQGARLAHLEAGPVSYTHLTLPTIYSV